MLSCLPLMSLVWASVVGCNFSVLFHTCEPLMCGFLVSNYEARVVSWRVISGCGVFRLALSHYVLSTRWLILAHVFSLLVVARLGLIRLALSDVVLSPDWMVTPVIS